jgi:FkbM family methyltransferase
MLDSVRHFICNNRRSVAIKLLADMSEKFLRAYHNDSFFEFERNGESFVMNKFASWSEGRDCLVWDIGANKGQWALALHAYLPNAKVTSFEILPPIFETLSTRAASQDWWKVVKLGLSDRQGTVAVTWNRDFDTTSSVQPATDNPWFAHGNLDHVECEITTLDAFAVQEGAVPIFLKIDTEGHDAKVLEGGASILFSEDAPQLIQFEYGHTWLPSGKMLGPIHRYLEDAGYRVGRVYPNYVDFKRFATSDENYRMGNIVAVKDADLVSRLS